MTNCIKIYRHNMERLKPLCDATRYHPARLANMMIEYALEHAKLTPTTETVYDIRFWGGSSVPSVHNTRQFFPQLNNLRSGMEMEAKR